MAITESTASRSPLREQIRETNVDQTTEARASASSRTAIERVNEILGYNIFEERWIAVVSQETAGESLPNPGGGLAAEFDALPDLDALAREQGVSPIENIDELIGDFWPEDESIDDFAATIRRWRDESDTADC